MTIKRTRQARTHREKMLGLKRETSRGTAVQPIRYVFKSPFRYRWRMWLRKNFPNAAKIHCWITEHHYVPFFRGEGFKVEQQGDGNMKFTHFFSEVYCTKCGDRQDVTVEQEGVGIAICHT